MKARKGFTLVELMVVVLIVGILAAVAIPMMQGRIDAAKWSEGKAAAGTIVSAVRAYAAEKGTAASDADLGTSAPARITALGFADADLAGTYFVQSNYVVSGISYDPAKGVNCKVVVTAPTGIKPTSRTLTVKDNVATWD